MKAPVRCEYCGVRLDRPGFGPCPDCRRCLQCCLCDDWPDVLDDAAADEYIEDDERVLDKFEVTEKHPLWRE